MSYTCAKFQGNKKNDLSTLVFLNQNSQNFTIISLIFNLKPEFFRIFQKKGPNFRKLRNLTYLELHVIQFWAKKKTFLDFIIHSSRPYLIPSVKKGYIQCTGTLLLIGNYPSANYPPSWDHPFDDPLWGPNLTLSFYISPREKIYYFKKYPIWSIFFACQNSLMWLLQK